MTRMFRATAQRLLAILGAINHQRREPVTLLQMKKEVGLTKEPLAAGGNARLRDSVVDEVFHALTKCGMLDVDQVTLDEVIDELAGILRDQREEQDGREILEHLENMLGLPYPIEQGFATKIPALRRMILGQDATAELEAIERNTFICSTPQCGEPIRSGDTVKVMFREAATEVGSRRRVVVPQLLCMKCAGAKPKNSSRNFDLDAFQHMVEAQPIMTFAPTANFEAELRRPVQWRRPAPIPPPIPIARAEPDIARIGDNWGDPPNDFPELDEVE